MENTTHECSLEPEALLAMHERVAFIDSAHVSRNVVTLRCPRGCVVCVNRMLGVFISSQFSPEN